MKIGRHRIVFGRTFWIQTRGPTTVRRFLFLWIIKEASPKDVDSEPQFPENEGKVYRYWKAGKES